MKAKYFSFQNCINISNDNCFEILPWYVTSVHTVNGNTKQAVAVSQWLTITLSTTWRPANPVGLGSHAIALLVCIDCGDWRARIWHNQSY